MHELGFENHINDFEFFHNLQHENNICNRERRSSFNTKVPTLK